MISNILVQPDRVDEIVMGATSAVWGSFSGDNEGQIAQALYRGTIFRHWTFLRDNLRARPDWSPDEAL